MRQLWNSFKIAFAMYSKIPMFKADWTKDNMKYAMCFFPLIGIIIGALLCGWNIIAGRYIESSFLRAVGFVLIPVITTGGIHLDGLLDTADALSSFQPMERKLEILKDSNAGAFAVITGCGYFILALGVWSELGAGTIPVLAGSFVLSRALSGLAVVSFTCARNSGLVAMFSDAAHKNKVKITMAVYILLCCSYLIFCSPAMGAAVIAAAAATFLYYYKMSKKEFGGITGDLAGYFLQICELAVACAVLVVSKVVL